ncbi:MAG: hypothetical protein KDC45_15620 [Bacteroidetes bacterium]|nr:hypothetical protein [Bacteroidota bacterium]
MTQRIYPSIVFSLFFYFASPDRLQAQTHFLPRDSILRITAPSLWKTPVAGKLMSIGNDTVLLFTDSSAIRVPIDKIKKLERRTTGPSHVIPMTLAVVAGAFGGAAGVTLSGNAHKDAGVVGFAAYLAGATAGGYVGWQIGSLLGKGMTKERGWEQIPVHSLRGESP